MRIHQIAAVVVLGVLTVFATSCSRMTQQEATEVRIAFGLPADMPLKDLGAVKLRVGTPQRVRAGKNEYCTITATTQTKGNIRFSLLYESDGEFINGVKVQPYSEQTQTELSQRLLASAMKSKSWLCFPRMHANFAVAMRPIMLP